MIGIRYSEPPTLRRHTVHETATWMDKDHWVTANKRRLRVDNMDDRHLINTVRMLQRNAASMMQEEANQLSLAVCFFQGEAASDAVASEERLINGMEPEEYLLARVPCYRKMLSEVKRRKLGEQIKVEPRRPLSTIIPEEDLLDPWGNS